MYIADIIIKSLDDLPIAIIEIKNREPLSEEIALELKQKILSHKYLPEYFIVLSQNTGFLWKISNNEFLDKPYKFSMKDIINKYFPKINTDKRLREDDLELIVSQWLNENMFK